MVLHPFFTKFFPNAISSLIKPDKNIHYRIFVVSKDNPLNWNPIFTGNDYGYKLPPYQGSNSYSLNQYNYDNLFKKYEELKKEYNELKNIGFSSDTLEGLRRELKEKENKINQLIKNGIPINTTNNNINNINKNYNQIQTQTQNISYNTTYNYPTQNYNNNNNFSNINNTNIGYKYKTNNDLRITYDDLILENYNLKNRLNQYETHYQQNQVIYLDNDFNAIRNSIYTNNKTGFEQAFDKLKIDIDTYTQNNYNAIISMKDKEIENWKREEKLRKEREDQEYKALIQAYDATLSMGERENAELKMRLKELQSYF